MSWLNERYNIIIVDFIHLQNPLFSFPLVHFAPALVRSR